jgi:anti-sigma B factor antagonist
VERHGDAVVVRLAGELDLYNVGEVGAALSKAGEESPGQLVVDLGEVDFLDSTALGALVEARRALPGTRLMLASPGPEILRALDVSGLAAHFEVWHSVEAALAAPL